MNVQSIRKRLGEIKGFFVTIGSEWVVIFIVILVGFGGFALGRLSGLQNVQNTIQTASVARSLESSEVPERALGGQLVASRNGSKYHFPWCGGAQQIAERNKIWFDSVEEARQAGYAPASNCKGLE